MFPLKQIHFVGIGGAGMSAIAWVLLKKGLSVSGSDVSRNPRSARLEKHGAKIYYGHDAENIKHAWLVVRSSAIRDDNPEMVAAKKMGVKVLHRSEMLAKILEEGEGVAVAGTHGKTTTTAMISLIMERAEMDPTVLIGGDLQEIGGNAKAGEGNYVVAEADESDGSFLSYNPHYAVITNVESDHVDHYKNKDQVFDAFRRFISQVKPKGRLILCGDDPGIRAMADVSPPCEMKLFSLTNSGADFYATDINLLPEGSTFTVFQNGKKLGRASLAVPGIHNIYNAMAAFSLARVLGIGFDVMKSALESFCGTGRRFQKMGKKSGILVIDDYAHHPTEVAATLKAARPMRNERKGRIVAVFQPHRYSRTKAFAADFAAALDNADLAVVTDVYSAGEDEIPGVSGGLIFESMQKAGSGNAFYVPEMKNVPAKLMKIVEPGDVVFTLGAGNVWKAGERFLEKLAKKKMKTKTPDGI